MIGIPGPLRPRYGVIPCRLSRNIELISTDAFFNSGALKKASFDAFSSKECSLFKQIWVPNKYPLRAVVFFCFLYQLYIYPVDRSRVNEFGLTGDEMMARDVGAAKKTDSGDSTSAERMFHGSRMLKFCLFFTSLFDLKKNPF